MAEDQQDIPAEDEEVRRIQGGVKSQQRRRVYGGYKRSQCNSRLEELAKPKRWYMLSTWREYGEIFEPERMMTFKEKIQEEFSMSPEETELYFSQLRKKVTRSHRKNALAKQLRRQKDEAKSEAYRIFKKLIRQGMNYAFKHPPPPIVSPMLRNISDTILEQLCELHYTDMPCRNNNDKCSLFLIAVADWTATLVGNIYYQVDVNEKIDIERLKKLERMSQSTASKEDKNEKVKKEKEPTPQKAAKGQMKQEQGDARPATGDEDEEEEDTTDRQGDTEPVTDEEGFTEEATEDETDTDAFLKTEDEVE